MRKPMLIAHLPTLHAGALDLVERWAPKVESILLVGDQAVEELTPVREIHVLPAQKTCGILRAAGYVYEKCHLAVLETSKLPDAITPDWPLIVTNDSVCRALVAKYFPNNPVEWETVFLHWDEESVMSASTVNYDRQVTVAELGAQIVERGVGEGRLTSDVFRRVGVVLFRDGEILLSAHNEHLPSDQTPYIVGDPRSFVEAGSNVHICGAIHGEANVIALAAKAGISTDGASVYQTVFPCVPCAYQLIVAGIKACYYGSGNAYLKVDETLHARGVEIVNVQP